MKSDTPTEEWPLEALCDLVAERLAGLGDAATAGDARVREAPDARTVRYYQTIGVLDRPLRYDGRRALYGRRHLLQILCVKLLQARGLSLAQVQQALAAASTAQLEAAVAEALGAAPPSPGPAPAPVVATWHTVELAPGVLLSIDQSRVPAAEALVLRLRAALVQPPLQKEPRP